ncbi:MAG TPA: MBL fold metallo-hydrolase [Deltaproteobacteria bacterium]|nr:MBL fold metallo-hydrolase [Deltaproteobacteria bacterium]
MTRWRWLGVLVILIGGLVVVPAMILIVTFSSNGPLVDGQVLPNGGIVVVDGYVSVALVPTGEGSYVLVDTGNDPAGAAIDRALQRLGASRGDVAAILITHGHPDHLGACGGFPDAKIFALKAEMPLLEGRVAAGGPLPRLLGPASLCPTERIVPVLDGSTMQLGTLRLQALAMPGHTAGSTAWWIDGVLFFGDAADARSDGTVSPAKWIFSDDQPQATASLERLAAYVAESGLRVDAMAFSHSGVIVGSAPLLSLAGASTPAP